MTLPTIVHPVQKPTGACDMIDWKQIDWAAYDARVQMYVSEGMDHSDAEAVVDAELLNEQFGKKEVDI
jgi:hypothetical protein